MRLYALGTIVALLSVVCGSQEHNSVDSGPENISEHKKKPASLDQKLTLENIMTFGLDRTLEQLSSSVEIIDASAVPTRLRSEDSQLQLCLNKLGHFTKDLFQQPYRSMLDATSKDFGDIGNRRLCEQADVGGLYHHWNANVTHLPLHITLGLCLPKECTAEHVHTAIMTISSFVE